MPISRWRPSPAGKLTGMLPQRLQDIYADLLTPADPEVEELVKAADKLSAHIKCLEEQKAGNDEFRAAARQTRQALEEMHLPEVDLFLRGLSAQLPADPGRAEISAKRPCGSTLPQGRFHMACFSPTPGYAPATGTR